MRIGQAIVLVLMFAAEMGTTGSPRADEVDGVNTETLWRGAFRGDSLFVRATWIPTTSRSWCVAFMGGNFEDTSGVRPKYLDYRVEDARGHSRFRDLVSGPEFFCCDGLTAEGTPWLAGIVIGVAAQGWGCEPAGNCDERRFIYIAGQGSIAQCDWTHIPWDPAVEGPIEGWVDEGCIEYPMTLKARLRDTLIVFEPALSSDVKEGDLLERALVDEMSAYCPREGGPQKPTTIELFPTPDSKAAERLLIRVADPIKIQSAVVRAERTAEGTLAPRLFRLGISALGRHGFVTPASLRSVGFLGL